MARAAPNAVRKGQGTFYYFNGDRYVGKWKRDKPEGAGIYYYTNGDRWLSYRLISFRFEGTFSAGKYKGKGIFFYGSLNKYEGDFTDGR